MDRFEAVRTLTGGEVFDTVARRTVDLLPSMSGAEAEARRLNRLVQGLAPRAATKTLAKEVW